MLACVCCRAGGEPGHLHQQKASCSATHTTEQSAKQTTARAANLPRLRLGAGQGDNGAGRGANWGGQGDWQLGRPHSGGLAARQAVAGADQGSDLRR